MATCTDYDTTEIESSSSCPNEKSTGSPQERTYASILCTEDKGCSRFRKNEKNFQESVYQTAKSLAGLDELEPEREGHENPLEGTSGFHKRLRTLDIAIVNKTKVTLKFNDEHFAFGSWYIHPKPVNIPPGGVSLAYVASTKMSPFGVKGGLVYELLSTDYFLHIGFENPTIGSYKTFIEINRRRKPATWACNKTKSGAVKNDMVEGYYFFAEIKPPKVSKSKLLRFTVADQFI